MPNIYVQSNEPGGKNYKSIARVGGGFKKRIFRSGPERDVDFVQFMNLYNEAQKKKGMPLIVFEALAVAVNEQEFNAVFDDYA